MLFRSAPVAVFDVTLTAILLLNWILSKRADIICASPVSVLAAVAIISIVVFSTSVVKSVAVTVLSVTVKV